MEISLAREQWELKGYWPWVPLKGVSMEIGDELLGVTEWMPATVPGGVHVDLFRAGFIEDPYRDLNSLHCEWVENRWWMYRCRFQMPAVEGETIELVCKGLDYEALVYFNGNLLGAHKGMYHPAVFDITSLVRQAGPADIRIVLKQAPDEMAQIGKTSETFTQKSRFNYKWDFSTRLVNLGLWDDVVIRVKQSHYLDNIHVATDVEDGMGIIDISNAVQTAAGDCAAGNRGLRLHIAVTDPAGSPVFEWEDAIVPGGKTVRARVEAPQLWYPNGYGPQPLYRVRMTLRDGSRVLDDKQLRTGIRKLRYLPNDDSPESALPYTFVVNDRRIYIKGANVTPLDHLYGNVSPERYEWLIRLAAEANLNMLRVWGGGVIEKTVFYELCDRLGILVWQEFIQSSSGVDNIPSKRPEFLELLRETAKAALKDRRNHVSLAVWSGGNELMSAPNQPSDYGDSNLAMLRELVEAYDPQRMFLPTSASGPVQYITEEKGVSHDVHGHWKYQGNPGHYKLYAESDNLFHSEFGVDGLSTGRSLRKFLSPRHLTPASMTSDLVWRHHGEWWDTYKRDTAFFGGLDHLDLFAACSQWIQAEGLRFILEANRRRKFKNSGSIIWQLNEPWPNISCTNLIDYYHEPKMAYYWVKQAFATNHASLDYRKLDFSPGEAFSAPVYIHHSGDPSAYTVRCELLTVTGEWLHEQTFQGMTERDKAVCAGQLIFTVPPVANELFFVRLTCIMEGNASEEVPNLYIFSSGAKDAIYASARDIKGHRLTAEPLHPWRSVPDGCETGTMPEIERSYVVRNDGTETALHVYAQETSDAYWMRADRLYETLFPGEAIVIKVRCGRRPTGLFEQKPSNESAGHDPQIRFCCFGSEC
ncbi:beta-mannosidase [Paenibacillus sp. UNC496MF]|uniref:glycoside hydrolase family 2 protein n=1 Tax=Paenibacillus sp. UNC496MF TaxID=1502753 RepID=UPI0008F1C02F|nr:glycoside hydrolase family 2 TIM barrel-domain containing protein [Paenibacillus sp. UNC496MF]SFJ76740.1 beta-mannosidase [Paenibacillus sp. UNC496MF]